MLFSSGVFLFAFLPLVLVGYYGLLRGHRQAQNIFLLVASLFFYAWGEPSFVLVMIASILVNYALGLWAEFLLKKGKKPTCAVVTAVAVNLTLFFVFKYLTFTLATLRELGLNVPLVNIALPIGISFFTFQALSYVLDVARRDAQVQKSPLAVGLYIAFFPQLIAGPIVKYRTIAHQIDHRQESWESFSQGCYRFLIGLGKKVLLSNQLALIADAAFVPGGPDSVAMAWLGSVCYSLQIYLDFSGYSDMAIGLGKMFGFQFEENFRYPYLADSARDFWRRWHISLGNWFRDYLFIPLGGSRGSKWRVTRNIFLVWLFTGIWHGANWTYLAWGMSWFLLQILERRFDPLKGKPLWLRRLIMLPIINFTMMIFRSDTLLDAWQFFLCMLKLNTADLFSAQAGYYLSQFWFVLVLAVLTCFPSATLLRNKLCRLSETRQLSWLMPAWDVLSSLGALSLLVLSAAFLVKGTYNPFIYFNF